MKISEFDENLRLIFPDSEVSLQLSYNFKFMNQGGGDHESDHNDYIFCFLYGACCIHYMDHDAESGVHWKEIAVPLVAFAAIVVYAVLFDLFGYFPATAVMLVGFMIALKVKPWWLILAITAGYALFIYLMFVVWLKVSII